MKLIPLLLFISLSTFAQQNDKPVNYLDKIDQDILDFDWKKEVFRMWDCYCPWIRADSVQQMPRELHPYQWDKTKPLVIHLDSTDLKFFKNKLIPIDSTHIRKKPISL